MLLTAVNVASRAFLGGVRVRLHENGPMGVGWVKGMDIATAVRAYGGEIVRIPQLRTSNPRDRECG